MSKTEEVYPLLFTLFSNTVEPPLFLDGTLYLYSCVCIRTYVQQGGIAFGCEEGKGRECIIGSGQWVLDVR
jgi:hypothetical protein